MSNKETKERTSVSLPRDLARRLTYEAEAAGRSASSIVADALETYFAERPVELPSFTGSGDSGTSDTSERAEEILNTRFRRKRA